MSIATTPPAQGTEGAVRPDAQTPRLRAVAAIEPERTIRLTIKRIGVASAARTAALLSVVVGTSMVGTGALLWWGARRTGLLTWFEEAIANGLGLESWRLPGTTLLLVWTAATAVLVALVVLVVTLLVVAFNQTGRSVGGVDVRATAQDVSDHPT